MGWHVITAGAMSVVLVLIMLAMFGDPDAALNTWLAAIVLELAAILSILMFMSEQGG